MELLSIRTENPKADQWKLLAQFIYPTNISKHMNNHGFGMPTGKTIEFIAGCIRQAEAYFISAEVSPIDISPLLLFYGSANLLAGASGLIVSSPLAIHRHGMKLQLPISDQHRIADVKVVPLDPENGALQKFADVFSGRCKLTNGASWTIEEILGSIPDLKRDFENCYPDALPYTVPVEIVRRHRFVLERIVPRELSRYSNPEDALSHIVGLHDAYLPAQLGTQMDYVILHRKIGAPEIGTHSIFGQKYLEIAHLKNGQFLTPNQIIIMYMGLFALGHLSRYHPDLWNPFIRVDDTGEKLAIEKFLSVCHRYLPNLVLNMIYEARIQFVYENEAILDMTSSLGEKGVRYTAREITPRDAREGST